MSRAASGRPAWLTSLVPLLLVVAGVHLALRAGLEPPRLFGDEAHYYLKSARADVEAGTYSLLPGTLPFEHRLRFPSRIYAHLRVSGDLDATVRNIEAMNILLCVLGVALVWIQARLLGLRPLAASLAGALVGLFPWVAFHVHSLWPETLHTFLFGITLTCLLGYLRAPRPTWLVPAGLALGVALLTKAVLQGFLPFLVLFVAFAAARRSDPGSWRRGVVAAGLFVASVALVVVPQVVRNVRDGHGPRLSANRWWNLELGLTPLPEVPAQEGAPELREARALAAMKAQYRAPSDIPAERERFARERTLAWLRERGVVGALGDQALKFVRVVLVASTCFDESVTFRARWGEPTPAWLSALRLPARVVWWGILACALAGLARTRCRSAGWCLTALVVGYVAAAVFLMPVKPRFFLPAFPALALLASETVQALATRRRSAARDDPEEPVNPTAST